MTGHLVSIRSTANIATRTAKKIRLHSGAICALVDVAKGVCVAFPAQTVARLPIHVLRCENRQAFAKIRRFIDLLVEGLRTDKALR